MLLATHVRILVCFAVSSPYDWDDFERGSFLCKAHQRSSSSLSAQVPLSSRLVMGRKSRHLSFSSMRLPSRSDGNAQVWRNSNRVELYFL